MAQLPIKQAVPRFQENEDRVNIFVNAPTGEDYYTTSEGESVKTLPKLVIDAEQAIQDVIDSGIGTGVIHHQMITTDGVSSTYPLTFDPIHSGNIIVNDNGIVQKQDSYSVVGTDLVFNYVPSAGVDRIEVLVFDTVPLGETHASQVSFTKSDSSVTTVEEVLLESSYLSNNSIIYAADKLTASNISDGLPSGIKIQVKSDESRNDERVTYTTDGFGGLVDPFSDNAKMVMYDENLTVSDKLDEIISSVPNIAALAELPKPVTSDDEVLLVKVLGFHSPGDEGAGDFYWDKNSTSTPVQGMIVNPNGNAGSGRWVRSFREVTPSFFGAKGDLREGVGTLMNGSNIVNSSNIIFSDSDVGKMILIRSHFSIPQVEHLSTIVQVNSPSEVVIGTSSAVSNLVDVELYVATKDDAAIQAATIWCSDNNRTLHFKSRLFALLNAISIKSNTTWLGDLKGGLIFFKNNGNTGLQYRFQISLREQAVRDNPFTAFSKNVRIEGMLFRGATNCSNTFRFVNIRGVVVHNNKFIRTRGATFIHEAVANYSLGAGTTGGNSTTDAAVLKGFSATNTDDLCEDIVVTNNHVDPQVKYSTAPAFRFEYVKRVLCAHNVCLASNISFWGGGAASTFSGYLNHQRRCVQMKFIGNHIQWTNGAIYGNCGTELSIVGNTAEYIIDTAFDMEGCTNYVVDSNTAKYCGNFCYSSFFNGFGGVWSNNIGIQSSKAANLRDQVGEDSYGPNDGNTLFRQLSAFSDSRPTYESELTLIGNSLKWEDDTGFGRIVVDTYTKVTIDSNVLKNVRVEMNGQANNEPHEILRNKFYYTNTPNFANSAYVILGARQRATDHVICEGNSFYVRNAVAGTIPLVVVARAAANDARILSVIKGNVIDINSAVVNAIGFGDLRTSAAVNQKARFLIQDNILKAGKIKNIGKKEVSDPTDAPVVVDINNRNFLLDLTAVDIVEDATIWDNLNT